MSAPAHYYARALTVEERTEIALAFGWIDVSGFEENLLGTRPMYDKDGERYAWLLDMPVPRFSYDILRFVRLKSK